MRWWIRHHDREAAHVRVWNDRVSIDWRVHPTVRNQGEKRLSSLIDAASGRVLLEMADEASTFVGDRVVHLPEGCKDDGLPGSGMLICGSQIRRIDSSGRTLWTVESAPNIVAYLGPDAALLASYGQGLVVVNPDLGDVLWRGDRRLDDLVGVTDGVVVWLDGRGQKGTVRLTGVDLRTGTQLWSKDTGLQAWSPGGVAAAGHGFVDVAHTGARDRRR